MKIADSQISGAYLGHVYPSYDSRDFVISLRRLSIENASDITAFAFDSNTDTLYWSHSLRGRLYRSRFQGGNLYDIELLATDLYGKALSHRGSSHFDLKIPYLVGPRKS